MNENTLPGSGAPLPRHSQYQVDQLIQPDPVHPGTASLQDLLTMAWVIDARDLKVISIIIFKCNLSVFLTRRNAEKINDF